MRRTHVTAFGLVWLYITRPIADWLMFDRRYEPLSETAERIIAP